MGKPQQSASKNTAVTEKNAAAKTPKAPAKTAKETSKTTPSAVGPKPGKKTGKADSKAKGRGKKTEDDDLDDGFLEVDVEGSDIEEYAEELEAVEELDEEVKDDDATWSLETKAIDPDEEVFLTDAEGNRYCRSKDCDQISVVEGYCRYHYLMFWKRIQVRKGILTDGKLERYVDELTARYPDKFLEVIRKDLRSQKEFLAAIQELEIDESALDNENEEDTQSYIDEVRGISEHAPGMDEEEF